MYMPNLKTSRLAPPEMWVARVGGSLHFGELAACESRCMCLVTIVLDDQKASLKARLPRSQGWTSANSFSRFVNNDPLHTPRALLRNSTAVIAMSGNVHLYIHGSLTLPP